MSTEHMTPEKLVKHMLDTTGYTPKQNILEPSFGTGNFLLEVANRIIQSTETLAEACDLFKETVYGAEVSKDLYDKAILRLNVLFQKSPSHIYPNLICNNWLDIYKMYPNKFDIVIGNPPYMRTH